VPIQGDDAVTVYSMALFVTDQELYCRRSDYYSNRAAPSELYHGVLVQNMIILRHDDGKSYDLRNAGNGAAIYTGLLSTNRIYTVVNQGDSLQTVSTVLIVCKACPEERRDFFFQKRLHHALFVKRISFLNINAIQQAQPLSA